MNVFELDVCTKVAKNYFFRHSLERVVFRKSVAMAFAKVVDDLLGCLFICLFVCFCIERILSSRVLFCHPERSRGISAEIDPSTTLGMTKKRSVTTTARDDKTYRKGIPKKHLFFRYSSIALAAVLRLFFG
jgi:hypothetical protein